MPKLPYVCDADTGSLYAKQGNDDDSQTAFTALKSQLALLGIKIPILYKQYTDLCLAGGIGFAVLISMKILGIVLMVLF